MQHEFNDGLHQLEIQDCLGALVSCSFTCLEVYVEVAITNVCVVATSSYMRLPVEMRFEIHV
jgi:hypothetical protein